MMYHTDHTCLFSWIELVSLHCKGSSRNVSACMASILNHEAIEPFTFRLTHWERGEPFVRAIMYTTNGGTRYDSHNWQTKKYVAA